MSNANRQRAISAVALGGFFFFAWSMGAFGGPIVCQQPLQAAAFTYQQPIVGGFYMPAEALQQRAAAQLQMESSPDLAAFRDFQRFRAYEAWQAAQAGELPAQELPAQELPAQPAQGVPAPATDTPPTAPEGGGPNPPPAPAEPGAWGAQYPVLMAKCSKCHSGADPDGQFILDGTADVKSEYFAPKRDAIMREIINRRMPRKPGTDECVPLTPEEMGAVVAELWRE